MQVYYYNITLLLYLLKNIYLMFLMFLQQGLCPGHILGEVVSRDERTDVADPRDEVAVVRQEAVQRVR